MRAVETGCVLAVDIGGSKSVVALVTGEGQILGARRLDYGPDTGGTALLEGINCTCREVMDSLPDARPRAIGVAIPGLADSRNGIWLYSPFSGIRDVPIAERFESQFGLPTSIQNDVNACALAEAVFGNCKSVWDYLWVTVSNGVGGALVLNGQLYEGGTGNAGEIGHVCVHPGGAQCACGNIGCLEAESAGPAISRMYRAWTGLDRTAKQIAQAAREGDVDAKRAFESSGRYIGQALAYAANLLNVQKIVLGGGVSMAFPLLEEGLRASLDAGLFRAGNANLLVEPTGLGYDAGLMGAAVLALKGG